MRAAVIVCGFAAIAAQSFHPVYPQILGTWLPNYGDEFVNFMVNESYANVSFAQLKKVGVNTLYIDVWHNGSTGYPSPTWTAATGLPFSGIDYLSYPLRLAKSMGMRVCAWFEYGLTSGGVLAAAKPQWLMGPSPDGPCMDPNNTEVQDFVVGIVLDALTHAPDLDCIQFDDHWSWPDWLPANETNVAASASASASDVYDGGANDDPMRAKMRRREWRDRNSHARTALSRAGAADGSGSASGSAGLPVGGTPAKQAVMTALTHRMYNAVKAAHPNVFVSLAPDPIGWAIDSYNVPWTDWLQAGIVEDAVMQLYTYDLDGFIMDMAQQVASVPPSMVHLLRAGIMINDGSTINANATGMVAAELTAAGSPSSPWGGQVLWYVRGLILYSGAEIGSIWSQIIEPTEAH